jgi:hypothetical protein
MSVRKTHLVPTHVRAPETLLTLAGVSLSVRQFLLLLVSVALGYQVWRLCSGLAFGPAGQLLRGLLTALPSGVALLCAFVSLAGRPLEIWGVVWLRYALRPHYLIWRSVRFSDPGLAGEGEEGEDD